MIKYLDVTQRRVAQKVLDVQIPSYQAEADLIGFDDLPPLKDTVKSIMNTDEHFYGYFIHEELAGAISYTKENELLDIHRLIVHPHYFRRGIGGTLLQFILDLETEAKKAVVSTGAKNVPAKALYKRFGFIEKSDQEVAPDFFITHLEKVIE